MTTGPAPLVGRGDPLARLRNALADTAAGSGGCVVVTGPAGIGKSRLLAAVAAEAVAADLAVASGVATELDRAVPFTTLLSALRHCQPAGQELARLTGGEPQLRTIDHVGEAIEEQVRRRPLVIVIDDAHWADELSALALRVLVPALAASPVRWLLSRRPVPLRSPAQEAIAWLIGEGALEQALEPLTEEAVAELCSHVLGAPPDATVLALAARGGGNPFLLEQLLIALRDTGRIRLVEGNAVVVGDDDLPASFLATVDRRLRGLSPQTRTLLEIGSVFGRPFTLQAVAEVAARPAGELVGAVAEAVRAGLLIDHGRRLAFRHDLLREAIYHHLAGPARAALHQQVATVLRAEGRPAAEVAEHLIRAGQPGEQAVKVLRDAAAQVAPSAPATAADLVIRALPMLDAHDPTRPELVADAVRLLASVGRLGEARELGEAALRTGMDPSAEATLLLGLAEACKHSGHNHLVVELTGRALNRPGLPAPITAGLLAVRAHALLYVGDLEPADTTAAEAVARSRAAGEPDAAVFGTVARSVVASARGQLDRAVGYAREAVRTADESGGAARHRHPQLWLGRALCAVDQFDEAEHVYATGQHEANLLATRWSQPLWHHFRAGLAVARGQLIDARAWAEAGLRVAEQLTARQMTVPLHALLAQVAVRRGGLDEAGEHLQAADRLVASGITVAGENLRWARAMLAEARGEFAAAFGILADLYRQLPRRMLLLVNEPSAAPALVRLAQRVGAATAPVAVAAIQRLADANPEVPSIVGAATHAAGLLHQDRRRVRTAVEQLRASPRRLALASALEDAAVLEQAASHPQRPGAYLEEALEIYTRSRADRDAARTRRRLAALGDWRPAAGSGGPSAAPRSSELTESELRVVRLVADGLTNREIATRLHLSPHTVDSHLRHVFTKWGVNSRVKLTRLYLDRPGDLSQA